MSHDSGFRHGGHAQAFRPPPVQNPRQRRPRKFEEQLTRRFRDHERKSTTQH